MDRVLEAVQRGVTVYDLAYTLTPTLPRGLVHPPLRVVVEQRHGDRTRGRGDDLTFSHECILTGGHVGTHIDALAHVSRNGEIHGGQKLADIMSEGLYIRGDSSEIPVRVGRGVLLDVARSEGTVELPPGFAIDAEVLARAQAHAGVEVAAGDVVLIRTGWSVRIDDAVAFVGAKTGVPGVDLSGADWLVERQVSVVGADTIAVEQITPEREYLALPVHGRLIFDAGILILEVLYLEELSAAQVAEFTIVLSPLKFQGGTAAPIRPLALVGSV